MGKIFQDPGTFLAMIHFRMELDRIGRLILELKSRIDHIGGGGDDFRPAGEAGDAVSMGHPDRTLFLDTPQQRRGRYDPQDGPPVFAAVAAFHRSAALLGQILGAVADAQQRNPPPQPGQVHLGRVGIPDRTGAAGEDDASDGAVQLRHFVIGEDFTENIALAKAPADQLGHLRAKVEYEDFIHDSSGRLWQSGHHGDGFRGAMRR